MINRIFDGLAYERLAAEPVVKVVSIPVRKLGISKFVWVEVINKENR